MGHISERWNKVKVVFIHKSGKTNLNQPKGYRPISLSSFLLKSLQRLVDLDISERPTLSDFAMHSMPTVKVDWQLAKLNRH